MFCDSFLIDEQALAIKSVYTDGYKSKIIRTDGVYFSKLSAPALLDLACLNYFSTKEGRQLAAKRILRFYQKPPFLIGPNDIGVFPTAGSNNPDCVWIFNHRFTLKEISKTLSIITFLNKTSIRVKASEHTILKQMHRLHALLSYSRMMEREKAIYI